MSFPISNIKPLPFFQIPVWFMVSMDTLHASSFMALSDGRKPFHYHFGQGCSHNSSLTSNINSLAKGTNFGYWGFLTIIFVGVFHSIQFFLHEYGPGSQHQEGKRKTPNITSGGQTTMSTRSINHLIQGQGIK